MKKELSEEEAIKFFREFIAKREGISEEEAGAKINPAVKTGLEILDPLFQLHKTIMEIGRKSPQQGLTAIKTVIAMLLADLPPKIRDGLLLELIKSGDLLDLSKGEINSALDKYLEKEKKK